MINFASSDLGITQTSVTKSINNTLFFPQKFFLFYHIEYRHSLFSLFPIFTGCKVFCDAVETEGYEIQNLIHVTGFEKGFLCANFVKPPVNIIFSFPFVTVSYSVLK
jgi:hypothetical protein